VLAIEHLSVLSEYVTVLLDFQNCFLDEFLVDWAFCGGVIIKRSIPFAEEFGDFRMVGSVNIFGEMVVLWLHLDSAEYLNRSPLEHRFLSL
jgi:hypothetical protein